ncbi:MAG: Dabb family protein [Nakamurella sp.]
MIRHILLVRCDPGPTSDDDLIAQFAVIAGLRPRLPGLLAVTFGPSHSPEDLERGYTHGLVADFADRAALSRYAADATHRAAGARITELAAGGVDGLLVVDLELPPLT